MKFLHVILLLTVFLAIFSRRTHRRGRRGIFDTLKNFVGVASDDQKSRIAGIVDIVDKNGENTECKDFGDLLNNEDFLKFLYPDNTNKTPKLNCDAFNNGVNVLTRKNEFSSIKGYKKQDKEDDFEFAKRKAQAVVKFFSKYLSARRRRYRY